MPLDETIRYSESFIDLNRDGKDEVIVYLMGRTICGSGGCNTLVLTPEGSSYRIVTNIRISRPPIRVLDSVSDGWRTLTVWVVGGGIVAGYEASLPFNGTTYPPNPSVDPASPLTMEASGETVIPASAHDINNGKPLYP